MKLRKWVQIALIISFYVLATILSVLVILGTKGLVYPIVATTICILMGLIINVLIRKSNLF